MNEPKPTTTERELTPSELSPKEKFLKGPDASGFSRLSATKEFINAIDYALLEMLHQQGLEGPFLQPNGGMNLGLDSHARLMGAQEFAQILKMLSVPTPKPRTPRMPQLGQSR